MDKNRSKDDLKIKMKKNLNDSEYKNCLCLFKMIEMVKIKPY